jgi:hypothetical protein
MLQRPGAARSIRECRSTAIWSHDRESISPTLLEPTTGHPIARVASDDDELNICAKRQAIER